MKVLTSIIKVEHLLNGELKNAWEFYLANKPEPENRAYNFTGMVHLDSFESALQSIDSIKRELIELYEREFEITKILIDKIDDFQDY